MVGIAGLENAARTVGLVNAGKGMYGKPNGVLHILYLTEFQTQANEYGNMSFKKVA